ncbi:putative rna interference and silencing protein [Phaeomoniella chlamydospora]|uniref:Putative rna interference and silencing protein n=1 Tax=Phaeomoniella chlamydospora TaxID=158046 RepID=A0A0G2GKV8_PHACM|nr:putative rna interference and silencing protein [Phaeomoniella chlamydospora]
MAERGRGNRGARGSDRGRGDSGFRGRGDRGHGDIAIRSGGDRGRGRGDSGYRGGGRGDSGFRGGDRGRGRGGGGRGGAPEVYRSGLPVPPINENVNRLEDAAHKKALNLIKSNSSLGPKVMPPRPGYGTQGKPVVLYTNYFNMTAAMDLTLYRYNIQVLTRQNTTPSTPLPVKKLRRVVELVIEDHLGDVKNGVATDFSSILIARSLLNGRSNLAFSVPYRGEKEDEPQAAGDVWNVRLSITGQLRFSELVDYLTSTSTSDAPKDEFIQALNVVVGHYPKLNPATFTIGGNKHFENSPSQRNQYDLGAGLQAIRGFLVSVRAATSRVLVNVQVRHLAVYKPGTLQHLVSEYLDTFARDTNRWSKLSKFLAKLRVRPTHIIRKNRRGEVIPRFKIIHALATPQDGRRGNMPNDKAPIVPRLGAGPKEVKFWWDGPAQEASKHGKKGKETSKPRFISVFDFFKITYQKTVETDFPVVNVGSQVEPMYLPIDVCEVPAGQTAKKSLQPSQSQNMIRFAVRPPPQNAASIVNDGAVVMGVKPSINETLKSFGVAVTPELLTVPGRILVAPSVNYDRKNVRVDGGGWNMRGVRFMSSGQALPYKLTLIKYHGDREFGSWDSADSLRATREAFSNKLQEIGIKLGQYCGPAEIKLDDLRNKDSDEQKRLVTAKLDDSIRRTLSDSRKPRLMVFILPSRDTMIYNVIKRLCDLTYGIINLCVVGSKFAKPNNDQYFANVGLKYNLKIGGTNHRLDTAKLGIIGEGNTMVVGLDVTHPSPGSLGKAPSIAGIVASIDRHLSQWPADIRIQEARKEMISDLESLMESRLKLWHSHNKKYPENIIVYRDGVSEGQYNLVLDKELPSMRNACKRLYPAQDTKKGIPRISILVVGKRHHTRFYPSELNHIDRASNPLNGTVVDRGITEICNWDFFLQSHTALQGTARPGHYYIILDEIFRGRKISEPFKTHADVLENLTHNLCYLFGRATKAVSICPAAYYADLLCERARCYLSDVFDPSEGQSETASNVTGGTGSLSHIQIHPQIQNTMFYI